MKATKLSLMKLFTALGLAAAIAAGSVTASDKPASNPPEGSAATVPADEVKLDGVVLARPDGGFLQIKMEGQQFVVRFYDKEKKGIKPDVDRATFRLLPAGRDPERVVLIPNADGSALTHGRPIRAPHVFKIFVGLFRGTDENAVESYSTQYP